jgi:hypothetical protein
MWPRDFWSAIIIGTDQKLSITRNRIQIDMIVIWVGLTQNRPSVVTLAGRVCACKRRPRFAGSQHAARNPCSTLLAVLACWNVAAREMAQCKRPIMIYSAVLFHWHDASQIVLSSSACFARTILRKSYQLFYAQERVGIEEATAKIQS